MILKAFRIKNYRSIIDTDWCNLSPDNVTSLIGQNESGKTSVLEALKSFYDGFIIDDIMRSDLSLPEVSCKFQLQNEHEYPDENTIFPNGINETIKENGIIVLTRSWSDVHNSKLVLNGDDIVKLYGELDNFWHNLDKETTDANVNFLNKRGALTDKIDELDQTLIQNKASLAKLYNQAGNIERQLRKTSDIKRKELLEYETSKINTEVLLIEQLLEKIGNELIFLKDERDKTSILLNFSALCMNQKEKVKLSLDKVNFAYSEIKKYESILGDNLSKREKRRAESNLEHFKKRYLEFIGSHDLLKKDLKLLQLELKNLLEGKSEFEARREAGHEFQLKEKMISREEAAWYFYDKMPHFELFEDFSSLLPNRIDLDDLFQEHAKVEGYKAVRNFLIIAGLDPEFFWQANNRILKQKIENLNNELTVNFHDYWGQQLGQANKIQIAFELEHYDYLNPEKKGKPYLEFWIKDKNERLYPKQRSRGLRWFLSFYLELKASATIYKGKEHVLLIDEPGLSLHARAQADVLKVFDDIKEHLQIIYTTHSPHLIDSTKLFRVIAAQRSYDSVLCDTLILNSGSLHTAAKDTLSPIYSLMGVRLSENEFIKQKNNVIIENITTYFYLSAMLPLCGMKNEVSFLPATNSQSIHLLANLMLGWGLDYKILIFDNAQDRGLTIELEKTLGAGKAGKNNIILHIENTVMVEDLFSKLDFKKHILMLRVGIPEANSEFILENNHSRVILATAFELKIKNNNLNLNDFDEETRSNFKNLAQNLNKILT